MTRQSRADADPKGIDSLAVHGRDAGDPIDAGFRLFVMAIRRWGRFRRGFRAAGFHNLASTTASFRLLGSKFVSNERRRLNPVLFGPGQSLVQCRATALAPALFGIAATTDAVLTGKRLAQIFGGNRRQRHANRR
jgi:hypothetical protein